MRIIDHDDVGAETGDRRKRHCPAITAGEIVELRNLRVVEPNPVAPPPLIPVRFDEHGETERASPAWRPVIGAVPLGRWETITFVAALRHNKMVAPMVVEGAMTGEMFLAYVENCLLPMLRRNDIVVMDNCRVHLGTGIRRAIETVGATLRYLPKYSPDLNPIEMPYSKFKTFLRKVAARTIPSLYRAIRSFIPQLILKCANYFRHAGYVSI